MENTTKPTGMFNKSMLLPVSIASAVAFVIGLIFGLVVLGWWVWPVKWIDASPAELQKDYQTMYLEMAIEAYGFSGDAQAAQQRFMALGDKGPALLQALASAPPAGIGAFLISDFAHAVGQDSVVANVAPQAAPQTTAAEGTPAAGKGTPPPIPTAAQQPAATEAPSSRSHKSFFMISLLCGISLLAIIAAAVLYIFRSRKPKVPVTAAQKAQAATAAARARQTDFEAEGREPPLSQFMTTYIHGDNLFDDSFSIDSPAGEFLGECGVGITETIGVGEPERVSAFEIWLFDKDDVQTVTKVLMSEHAFNDEATRQRLAAKGDPVMAKPGEEIVLETAKLQLVARVVDMAYGEDALPNNSYFERLTLELAVWSKA